MNERFQKAMELTGSEFMRSILHVANSWIPARALVQKALDKRYEHDPSGQVMVLEEYTIWTRHLLDLETELKIEPSIKYVLFGDSTSKWRVQAVPIEASSFICRKPLPEAWRGLRDAELSKLADIPKCIFVHASGFIGGNDTFEGALAMARRSLELDSTSTVQTTKNKIGD